MEEYSIDLERILIQQLKKKGIEQEIIPRFIKDMRNSYFDNPSMSLLQINNRLKLLGWSEMKLDYHTFQLILSYIEKDRLESPTNHS